METAFGSGQNNQWWHWWTYTGKYDELAPEFRDWEISAVPWVAIYEREIASQLFEIIMKVRDAFHESSELLRALDA